MKKYAVYFFAEYAFEFAIWSNLAENIRSIDPSIKLELIYAKEPRINDFNLEMFFTSFDEVHEVGYVSHEMQGSWRQGFIPRNIYGSLTKVFPKARKVFSQLNQIHFVANSMAFVYQGITLNQAMFLKSVKSRPKTQSVLLLREDSSQDSFLTNYIVNYSQSLLLNFFFHFFGTAYMDVFWARVREGFRTSTRDYIHRNKPADYVFQSVHPYRLQSLQPGKALLPLNIESRVGKLSRQETVIFIGQPHYFLGGFSKEVEVRFYKRLNTILDIIREIHKGHHLIYKRHPGQTERQLSQIKLDDFEIIKSSTSEGLFQENKSITTAYGFSSLSLQTALCYGIKSHYVYRLFYDILKDLPLSVRNNWEQRWDSEYHPEIVLRSIDDWKSGKNDYCVNDISNYSKSHTMSLLAKVGIINLSNTVIDITELEELTEERWAKVSEKSTLSFSLSVILFLPKLILLFFYKPALDLIKKLREYI